MRAGFHQPYGAPVPSSLANLTDGELLKRFLEQHDQSAFEAIVKLHGPMVYGVCRRILSNHHDAEDAFQATFLSLARKADSIVQKDLPANWLYRVAHRAALKTRATAAKRRQREMEMQRESRQRLTASDAEQRELWAEVEPLLDKALSALPYKFQVAVILCDLQGKTRREAAKRLGWLENTLSSRLRRARMMLAKRLMRHGVQLSAGALVLLLSKHAASAAVPQSLVVSTVKAANVFVASRAVPPVKSVSRVSRYSQPGTCSGIGTCTVTTGVVLAVATVAGLGFAFWNWNSTGLPSALERALEENAAQLNPITASYTRQFLTPLPREMAVSRLKLGSSGLAVDRMFSKSPCRVTWQQPKLYAFRKELTDRGGEIRTARIDETSFDGETFYESSIQEDVSPPVHSFSKVALTRASSGRRSSPAQFDDVYFQAAGFRFPASASDWSNPRPESELLRQLHTGAVLVSVEEAKVEDRKHVKVTLDVKQEKPDEAAIERQKQLIREMTAETPARKQEMIDALDAQLDAPVIRRFVYYLDSELHYAVRRAEQWYAPDVLLVRTECSRFEKLPGRDLWLPRICRTERHEIPSAGEIVNENLLTEVVEVSEFRSERVAEEQFVLNQTGTDAVTRRSPPARSRRASGGGAAYARQSEKRDRIIDREREARN